MIATPVAAVLIATVLGACGISEDLHWPQRPPDLAGQYTATLMSFMRKSAGERALNCGVADNQSSLTLVHACAEQCFPAGRPFYFAVEPWRRPRPYDGIGDGVHFSEPPAPAAEGYFSPRDGDLLSASIDRSGKITAGAVRFKNAPLRPFGLVRRPVLLSSNKSRLSKPYMNGIMIFECIVDADGTVSGMRVLKALPPPAVELGEALVRAARYRAATLLGSPVAVIINVTVRAEAGTLELVN